MNDSGPRPPRRQVLLRAGRFFGVPIYFAPSWLIIAAIITLYYGPVVRDSTRDASTAAGYGVALAFAVAFALCVLLHELGHTAVALLLKTPVRQVVIFLLGGASELGKDPERPRDEFLIAAAGPAVSFVLTGLCALGLLAVDPHTLPSSFVWLLVWSNATVAVFNALPALPLDGGRLLRAAVWAASGKRELATRVGGWAGRVLAVAILVAAVVLDRYFGTVGGISMMVLALYLWVGATQTLRIAEVSERVPSVRLEALLRPGLLVPPGISIAEATRRAWDVNARGLVIVDAADRPEAIVDEARLAAVPVDQRPWTQLSTVARHLESGLILNRHLAGEQLLTALRLTPAPEYLVVNDDGTPAGILSLADFVAAVRQA